jgi:hypothetical protein
VSTRLPHGRYHLFADPVLAGGVLDRMVHAYHRVIMDGPSYRHVCGWAFP